MSKATMTDAARALAQDLRATHGDITAPALAQRLGVAVRFAAWQVAQGRVVYFAECARAPLQITLNETALAAVAAHPRDQLVEVVIAHELFHLLTPPPSVWAASSAHEQAAHAFAQAWTGLPFHPTQYEHWLWEQRA